MAEFTFRVPVGDPEAGSYQEVALDLRQVARIELSVSRAAKAYGNVQLGRVVEKSELDGSAPQRPGEKLFVIVNGRGGYFLRNELKKVHGGKRVRIVEASRTRSLYTPANT